MREDLNARTNTESVCQRKQKRTEDQGKLCSAHQEQQRRKPKPENNEMKKGQICAVLSKNGKEGGNSAKTVRKPGETDAEICSFIWLSRTFLEMFKK